MRIIPDQLKSKNLVPFKKRHGKYTIPGMTSEHQVSLDRVDSDLSPEEQGYIRHYLGYADSLLRSVPDSEAIGDPQEAELPPSDMGTDERRIAQRPSEERSTTEPPTQSSNKEMEQPSQDELDPGKKEDSSQAA